MKKFAIALAAVATGFAATADVSSANVVGYMNKATVVDDNHYFVHTFAAVGGSVSAVPLSSIKPGAGWDANNGDYLATVLPDGSEETVYSYFTAAQAADIEGCTNPVEGWYEFDFDEWAPKGNCANSSTIQLKGGFLVYSLAGANLELSGEVISGDTALLTIEDDNAYTGNITPTNLKIGDIVPDATWDANNGDYLATVLADGSEENVYSYFTAAQAADIPGCTNPVAGWYQFDFDEWAPEGDTVNLSTMFPAGTGFLIYSMTGATLTVPSPLPEE